MTGTTLRTIAATALVALLAPAAAGAKEAKVEGPAALAGKGFFTGELELGSDDGQRPVRIGGKSGYVGFLDLGGDLKVRCSGKGRVHRKETEKGTVYLCAGQGGQAVARGSHFKLRGFALRYRVLLPAGASGSFKGRFILCAKGEEQASCERSRRTERGERGERGKQGDNPARDQADEQAEGEIPTLEELAAELAGK